MDFAEGAKLLYDCAKESGDKLTAGGLLERMTQVAMTLRGVGAKTVAQAWRNSEMAERWAFCCEMADE